MTSGHFVHNNFTSTGQTAVVLAATADGGAIQACGAGGKPAAELGASDRHQHGMMAVYQADGPKRCASLLARTAADS